MGIPWTFPEESLEKKQEFDELEEFKPTPTSEGASGRARIPPGTKIPGRFLGNHPNPTALSPDR